MGTETVIIADRDDSYRVWHHCIAKDFSKVDIGRIVHDLRSEYMRGPKGEPNYYTEPLITIEPLAEDINSKFTHVVIARSKKRLQCRRGQQCKRIELQ